ncbi:hypothetical protein GOODEAATRI_018458, partial [Goodea atripinnis]
HIPAHERGFGVCRALAVEDLAVDLTSPGWIPCSKDRQGCWLPCGPRAETAQRRASLIMAASATHKPGKRQITHISTECKLPYVLLPYFSSMMVVCSLFLLRP